MTTLEQRVAEYWKKQSQDILNDAAKRMNEIVATAEEQIKALGGDLVYQVHLSENIMPLNVIDLISRGGGIYSEEVSVRGYSGNLDFSLFNHSLFARSDGPYPRIVDGVDRYRLTLIIEPREEKTP